MRIDGYSSSYHPQLPGPRPGAGSPTPPAQAVEPQRSAPQAANQAERYQQLAAQRVAPAPDSLVQQRPLSAQAAQAIASYTTTASHGGDPDALEVLGLDLYA